ncbi:hypothetical protein PC128_g4760 [Phytophthora cactorum]|nr:hypothetical protein PC120_g1824 [Phytophthora cactorum]KAG3200211.1 hypothetical protein PC128_g4760 [Phytophthora cactorum]KAG4062963.1 hypothetical protein PC123_g2213 [Phytophthora cactorum]
MRMAETGAAMTARRQDGAHSADRLKSWHCWRMVEAGWSQATTPFLPRH